MNNDDEQTFNVQDDLVRDNLVRPVTKMDRQYETRVALVADPYAQQDFEEVFGISDGPIDRVAKFILMKQHQIKQLTLS